MNLSPTPNPPRRRLTFGLTASILAHLCLLAALVVIPYRYYASRGQTPERTAEQQTASGSSAEGAAHSEPAPEQPALSNEQAARAEKVMAERVESELQSALSQAEGLADDEKLDKLAQLSRQLDRVASEKSVDELAKKLQVWLKTEDRATAPAENRPEGEFDYSTAQFHEMKREELPEGGYRYASVLLDAAGRTVEIEMDAAEAETTYRALALLKASPLAEKLYRQAAMPLLDKLLKAAEQIPVPAAPAEESSPEKRPEAAPPDAPSAEESADSRPNDE